jgi:TRAP-type C4-dicarboxylate transport system substrate-binding protein
LKKVISVVIVFSLVLFIAACGNTTSSNQKGSSSGNGSSGSSDQEKYVLKVSHGFTTTAFVHKFVEWFDEEVQKRSDGRLSLEIYPNAQLMPVNQEVAGLLNGEVDMIQSTSPVLATFDPIWNFYNLPFIFNYDPKNPLVHLENMTKFNTHEKGGKVIQQRMEEKGVKVLGMVYNDYFGSIFTNDKDKLITDVESAKGLKVRTPGGNISPETLSLMGASGVTIAGAEAITALQTGVVDGTLTTPMYAYDAKLPIKTYTVAPIFTALCPLLISVEKFNSLPQDLQDILVEVGEDYPQYVQDVVHESLIEKLKLMESEMDVEIYYPTEAEIKEMKEATRPVWNTFEKEVDGAKELIDALETIQ